MVRNNKVSRVRVDRVDAGPISLAYTYAGEGEEEVCALKSLAYWWARLGKTRLAQALAQLADDLEQGIVMGVLTPGDTVYHIV